MDRNREARRTTMTASNGLPRRRHRSNSLRDSPEEDGPVELQETARLRDRGGSGKKDRDRDRDRERDRERERERDRDRLSRSKRRRGDRLIHGSNREDGGDDSSEESVNDEDEDEDDDGGGGGGGGGGGASVRMLPPPNPSVSLSSSSSSMLNHHRKSFPPAKTFRAAPAWKAADEMIGVPVPRKARSASTKRSHEWASSVVGEPIHRQASTSPVRPSLSSMAAAAASPAPTSPSSSNPSLMRKKLKPNGPKLRPTKTSSKPSSSAQDEIEIEIAEVLYEMMRQPQGPSKQEILATDSIKFESREANKSTSDAKSRVSSPISNSPSALPQSSQQALPQNSSSSVTTFSATAPKRKRPRPVKYEDENPSIFNVQSSPISSSAKLLPDQPAEIETSSPNLEKNSGSAAENGGVAYDLAQSHAVAPSITEAQPESIKAEGNNLVSDSKLVSEKSESQDLGMTKEESQSPKKDSPALRLDDNREDTTTTKAHISVAEIEIQREEKFQIDLMAPPPLRSSPERDREIDFVAVDAKPMVIDTETEIKPIMKGDAKTVKIGREDDANVEIEKSKNTVAEEADFKKPTIVKERNIDLQLDLEKTARDSGTAGVSGNKLQQQQVPKQQQQQHNAEKNAQSSSLPLPMSMAGWPGALHTMRYMAPLQGVVSMDGSTVTSAAIQPPPYLFNQPRPKKCATHCYIARNICYHQQIARMNSFWPAAAGSGPLYGAKPCNLNVLPSTEMHGNIPGGGVNSTHDKGQGLAIFPGHAGKDKGSQTANIVDAQRKQILLQQALPPGAPSNILHGPAFIFPLSQQQAAAAASVRPGSVRSPPTTGNVAPSSTPNSTTVSAPPTPGAAAPAMSFNYPNIPTETPYLAILQNNPAYPFPLPAHVGAPPAYRGTHAQMPFFNGSFYSSQMLHPSQIQQQQPPNHSQQSQQGHQNATISSGSSSSQKHLQNQQQRPHASGINGGSGSLQGFPASKGQSSQPLQQLQQRPQQQNQHIPHQARQLESEIGGEDSPSTADSQGSRASMSIYGQNFPMSIHAPNFALMTPPVSLGGANGPTGASGSNSEKKQQQQSAKGGVEASQAFAMSFANVNGATAAPGLDIASIAQHQAILQSVPDVRQGYHFMATASVAQAPQQKKNYRVPEDGKTGCDSSSMEDERKAMAGKASSTVGQSIAFSRPDLSDTPGSNVIDSSARTLNLGSNSSRASSSVVPPVIGNVNAPNSQQQIQRLLQQQQQMNQLHKQQQQLAAAARTKTPATSNGGVYSDHLPSTSIAAKFPNALSSFPPNLAQSSSSPSQPPQWKNSVRTSTSQVPPPSMASSNSSSLKNLPQQQGRMQQSHTQISFAANPKGSTQPQGLQPTNSNQSPSPPIMVASPTTSMSKSAGGSPRTTTTSTGNKTSQASSLSAQQAKNSPTIGSLKSSPVGGRNVPSILGNPHISSSSSAGTKPQQQQQLSKQSVQQAQLIFSNAYMQPQTSHSNSNTSNASAMSGYYNQRRRNDQQPQQSQQLQNSSGTSSGGMLSLCSPVTLSNTSTSDPAKAVAAAAAAAAAAAGNIKGALPSQSLFHPAQFAAPQSGNSHQLLPFSYGHAAVPTAVQVKPAEQKQPAGE